MVCIYIYIYLHMDIYGSMYLDDLVLKVRTPELPKSWNLQFLI